MILVLDTETTGLPKDYKAPVSDLENWPRAVEIAWATYQDNGQVIESYDEIIYPDGFEIPADATAKHGITTQFAQDHGTDLLTVLTELGKCISDADVIVAHNIDFDYKILGAEFFRRGLINALENKALIDTMKESTDFCAIKGPRGNKWPKLAELYAKLFPGEIIEGEHRAGADAAACARCFFELVRLGVITVKMPEPAPIAPELSPERKLEILAAERQALETAKINMTQLIQTVKLSDTYTYNENAAKMHADSVSRLEAEIKADYVAAFDGNKKPSKYVSIVEKDVTGVIYDKWSALHWCLNNLTVAVGLDVDEFEFQAKRGKLPPNIVTIQTNKELRAQIAQDLSDLLLPF